jgi:hypothetical protein
MIIGMCTDPRCKLSKRQVKKLYLHSARFYCPEKLKDGTPLVKGVYYWACEKCIRKDYEDFKNNQNKYLGSNNGHKFLYIK